MAHTGRHGEQPNKTNYEDLVRDLQFGTMTIRLLEMAYREYIRRRTDIPEGARNLLVGTGETDRGIVEFASRVGKIVGNVELSYLRGRQEGHEFPNKEDWDGGYKNRAIEKE